MAIIEIVNSYLSKPGNIGIRTGHIINNDNKGLISACICRGTYTKFPNVKIFSMGFFGLIPRLLNYMRNYFPNFDHRPLDIMIFNIHFFIGYMIFRIGKNAKVAHLWEMSPFIIRLLQKNGVFVILDVPIAPALYAQKRYEENSRFVIFKKHIENENKCFELANLIIAPSNFVRDALIDLGCDPKKIRVIEFGTNESTSKKNISQKSKDSTDRGYSYVFAGALNPRKGIDILIEAWDSWPYNNDELHLCGRQTPYIKKVLENKAGLNIFTPGFVSTHEYFSKMDIFVFPSFLEGSAKAVFEALCEGLPCVVTEESGSVVRNGKEGYIVNAGDIDGLRKAMLKIRDIKKIKDFSANAFNRAAEYPWSRYTRKVLNLYQQVSIQ